MKKYLFHVTPDSNMKTIGAQGLVPRERRSVYNILNTDIHYPKRTYFFLGDDGEEAKDYAMRNMPAGRYNLSPPRPRERSILFRSLPPQVRRPVSSRHFLILRAWLKTFRADAARFSYVVLISSGVV